MIWMTVGSFVANFEHSSTLLISFVPVLVLVLLVRGSVTAFDDPQTTKNLSAGIDVQHSVIDNDMSLPSGNVIPVTTDHCFPHIYHAILF